MEPKGDIALIGLAVMGQNLILNMNDHGFTVVAYNRTTSKVDEFLANEAKGTKVLDNDASKYEAAKKATQRLLKDICGDASSGKQEEVEVPAEIIEAAKKLAKLAQKYEGARSLASKAVAIAFAQ